MKVAFDPDRRRAMTDTKIWACLALPGEQKVGVEDPRELERLANELSAEEAAKRWIVSDDPEEHVEAIRPYVDLGFNHLVFHAPGDDQLRFLQTYGEQILPRLRERFGAAN
jgi:coenzyme F420-dependent glucose-6-phosphate dehydrogenase